MEIKEIFINSYFILIMCLKMNKKLCEEIIEEYHYIDKQLRGSRNTAILVLALQVKKLNVGA